MKCCDRIFAWFHACACSRPRGTVPQAWRCYVLRTVAIAVAFIAVPAFADAPSVSEPSEYRTTDYRTLVPATLKGARVVSTEEAEVIWKQKSAIFIDVFPRAPKPGNLPVGTVWRTPTHQTLEGAVWLPNIGYGALAPEVEEYFRNNLQRLTAGDKSRPVVYFCQRNCWMSWNAAKRAVAMGWSNVIWYPDGTDGWVEAGSTLVTVEQEP